MRGTRGDRSAIRAAGKRSLPNPYSSSPRDQCAEWAQSLRQHLDNYFESCAIHCLACTSMLKGKSKNPTEDEHTLGTELRVQVSCVLIGRGAGGLVRSL